MASTTGRDIDLLPGRFVDRCIDMEILRSWLHICETRHDRCGVSTTYAMDFGMRVIDIHCRCVVKAPRQCRYVALSYVWGKSKPLLLTEETIPRLRAENSLQDDDDTVPQTIRDAMLLCQQMGEDYLWVDALCIQQDSEEDKKHQFNMMGSIYQCATLTIVAACGDSAASGLSGLRPDSRIIKQASANVGDLTLGNTLALFMDAISDSVWNGRGWTCQEKHLSNRLLIFTSSQVFYQCQTSTFSEDVELEADTSEAAARLEALSMKDFRLGSGRSTPDRFATLLADYTRRQLSYESDTLNALSGILGTLSYAYDFFWGHPAENLLETLYWHSAHMSMKKRRPAFPSWSWDEWAVPVDRGFLPGSPQPCEDRYPPIYPITRLCRVGSKGQSLPIDASDSLPSVRYCHLLDGNNFVWEPCRPRYWEERDEYPEPSDQPYAWNIAFGKPMEPPPLTQEELLMMRKVRTRLLRFYSWTFRIPVGTDPYEENNERNEVAHSLWIGWLGARVWVDPEWRKTQPEKLTFIALAQKRLPQWGATSIDYFLLLIEEKDGVAYRIQRADKQIDSQMLFAEEFCPEWRVINLA